MTEAPVVGICTFQRPGVVDTVRSIFVQTLKPARIIIVDNDDAPTAQSLIAPLRAETDIHIEVHHVPGRNNAIARNAVLDAAGSVLIAWIDDDEVARADWLENLYKEWQAHPGCAAIFAPQIADYPPQTMDWITDLAPHSFHGFDVGGEVKSGSTGNCLVDLRHPALNGIRFNEQLKPFGGEDTQYFFDAHRAGAEYHFSSAPIVTETVFPERLTWRWLLRRKFRQGMIYVRAADIYGPQTAAVAALKMVYFAGSAAIHIANSPNWQKQLLRLALQAGILRAAIGLGPRPIRHTNMKG